MIRFQVIEREGADLYRHLLAAMRSGDLRTFLATRRGRRVQHRSPSIPGWLKWSSEDGILLCEIVSPRKPETEWHFFSAFLGRLAHRFADRIHSISVQFRTEPGRPGGRRRRRRTARRPGGQGAAKKGRRRRRRPGSRA